MFLKTVVLPARGGSRICSHSRTSDATSEKIAEKKFNEIQWVEFFCDKIMDFFKICHQMQQPPRAGDATILKKIASPSQAKTRSCRCSLTESD